jgi:uncharacterized protein
MDKQTYQKIEAHMLRCMCDMAHDAEHVYRVLYNALNIAVYEQGVDYDVLIAACLLHDIGRVKQFENPKLCHAVESGYMAFSYLLEIGFLHEKAEQVKECIVSHRYRSDAPPTSLEAKILFDADKVDVTGAIGVARTLFYKGHVGEALYAVDKDGNISDGTSDNIPSFFREYHYKLKRIYNGCYTRRGDEISKTRRKAMDEYYNRLLSEVKENRKTGMERLEEVLEE